MIDKKDEALKLALEALAEWKEVFPDNWDAFDEQAITAIRKALSEQPAQQEPTEKELSNGLAMALHDAVLIRIGGNDEATQQACARIDKLADKYRAENPDIKPAQQQNPVAEWWKPSKEQFSAWCERHNMQPSDRDAFNDAATLYQLSFAAIPQPAQQQEPVARVDYTQRDGFHWLSYLGWQRIPDGALLYTSPPASKPDFKAFKEWAVAEGYDTAHAHDGMKWVCLNPMTADLWKAWQAAHGIKEKNT